MEIQYSLIVKNLTTIKEIVMFLEEQQQDHIQTINFQSNKEDCDICEGSGTSGDGTCPCVTEKV